MATVTLGSIKFNWKGAYNSSTAYAVDDVVSSGGNSYVCIQAHTNQAVGNATAYWNIMSAAGTDGTDLTSTLTTQGDILYRDGSGLQRLGAGTSGQFLKTQGASANPVWATNTAGIAQFKHTNQASGQTHASSSYTTLTGVTATLTPASTSSKVYIMFGIHGRMNNANSGWRTKIQRVIGGSATDIWEESDQKATYINGSSAQMYVRTPYAYLDTPNTTSAVTYQAQVYTDGNSTVLFNTAGPSYITIMEVTV